MPPHTLKTLAVFIAALGIHGAAFAQTIDAQQPDGGFVVDEYYKHMDRQYVQFTEAVVANAHARMRHRFVSIDRSPRHGAFTGGFAGSHIAR